MTHLSYSKPPITEAVIEIRFSAEVDESVRERLTRRYVKNYPEIKPIENHKYELDLQGQGVKNSITKTDFKLSSEDMSQILILRESAFLISQLAPYGTWEEFITRFERDWGIFEKSVGHKEIERVGVRFINRIDIPNDGDLVYESEYVNIYPKLPENLQPTIGYSIQMRKNIEHIESVLTLSSAIVSSPVPDHISIIIDQDIARNVNLPQRTQTIVDFLNSVRTEKNNVFESCITDKARELFGR